MRQNGIYGSRKCPVSGVFDHTVYSFLLLSNFAYLATKIDLYLDSTGRGPIAGSGIRGNVRKILQSGFVWIKSG